MSTYPKIQVWVKENYGFTPETCWIAHVKEISGLKLKKAHNRINPNVRQCQCPQDKINAITSALRYFRMIP